MKPASNKKRVIVDYKKIAPEVKEALNDAYPYGYEDSDILKFTNLKGEKVSALSVETEEAIYLVKIHVEMSKRVKPTKAAARATDDDDDSDDDTDDVEIDEVEVDEKDDDDSDDDA